MMPSNIEWTEETWNPVTGCTKISYGCTNCYAEKMAKRLQGMGQKNYANGFDVTCHEHMLDIPLKRKKPTKYFVCSMGDLFHDDVDFEFIDAVFTVMALSPQHQFIILTKRPERMLEYFDKKKDPFFQQYDLGSALDGDGVLGRWPDWESWETPADLPETPEGFEFAYTTGRDGFIDDNQTIYIGPWPLPNLMLGVSVEHQPTADKRIPLLLQTPAAKRVVSYEPALALVEFNSLSAASEGRRYLGNFVCNECEDEPRGYECECCVMATEVTKIEDGLDLVIMGGESGLGARPMHPDWPRKVRDECVAAGVPFFFKQWGAYAPCSAKDPAVVWVTQSGQELQPDMRFNDNEYPLTPMKKVGKKAAGDLLDGKQYREWPS